MLGPRGSHGARGGGPISPGSSLITPHTAQGLLSQNAEALRFCVVSEIDLSQITADLTVLMAEVDRIEAIAAGKTPADADEPTASHRHRPQQKGQGI